MARTLLGHCDGIAAADWIMQQRGVSLARGRASAMSQGGDGWWPMPWAIRGQPPHDYKPVEVRLANGVVTDAVFWCDDRTDAGVIGGQPSQWLRIPDLTLLPGQPIAWRPLGWTA